MDPKALLAARTHLMEQLRLTVQTKGWGQVQAAEKLGIARTGVDDLLRGRVDAFSLESLANMAARVGLSMDKIAAQLRQGAGARRQP